MKSIFEALLLSSQLVSAFGRHLSHQVPLSSTTPAELPNFSYNELYMLNRKFLDNFIYPANVEQAKSIQSDLLAEGCQGRVDATRTFDGRELNTEYLFGLFANLASSPHSISLLGVPVSYEITHFAAHRHASSVAVKFEFHHALLNLTFPVEIGIWSTWDTEGKLTQYDSTIKWWQWMLDYIVASRQVLLYSGCENECIAANYKISAPLFNTTTPVETIQALTKAMARSVCETAQTYCTGEDQQYDSVAACYHYLTEEVRFGSAYELGRNTLACRTIHQNMVALRPSVHCSHIGPSGGEYCVDDMSYISTVNKDYFRIPFVPV